MQLVETSFSDGKLKSHVLVTDNETVCGIIRRIVCFVVVVK